MKKIFYVLILALFVSFAVGEKAHASTLSDLFNLNSDGASGIFALGTGPFNPPSSTSQNVNTYSYSFSGNGNFSVQHFSYGSSVSSSTETSQVTTSQSDSITSTTSSSDNSDLTGESGSLVNNLFNKIFGQ